MRSVQAAACTELSYVITQTYNVCISLGGFIWLLCVVFTCCCWSVVARIQSRAVGAESGKVCVCVRARARANTLVPSTSPLASCSYDIFIFIGIFNVLLVGIRIYQYMRFQSGGCLRS